MAVLLFLANLPSETMRLKPLVYIGLQFYLEGPGETVQSREKRCTIDIHAIEFTDNANTVGSLDNNLPNHWRRRWHRCNQHLLQGDGEGRSSRSLGKPSRVDGPDRTIGVGQAVLNGKVECDVWRKRPVHEPCGYTVVLRSEEHTSELQSLR